jgi:endogenous inhibitor of DNA gyrase (YacG/DUF329 family)
MSAPTGGAKPAKAGEARTCVICAKPRNPRYDPFCSKRCADVDLHRWLKGTYVVPGAPARSGEPEDEAD